MPIRLDRSHRGKLSSLLKKSNLEYGLLVSSYLYFNHTSIEKCKLWLEDQPSSVAEVKYLLLIL